MFDFFCQRRPLQITVATANDFFVAHCVFEEFFSDGMKALAQRTEVHSALEKVKDVLKPLYYGGSTLRDELFPNYAMLPLME